MAQELTDTIVKKLHKPDTGNRVTYDERVKGFGVRVTAGGTKAFVLNYRTRGGRERRYTIGAFPEWKVAAARKEAGELKKRIDRGEDPMAEVQADRDAKTVAHMCERFAEDHFPRCRPATARDYKAMIENEILPVLKHRKVAEVTFSDVDGLHRKITKRGTPYRANRIVALLSKMFALAIRWGWRADNPAKGIERNQEEKRHRYLSPDEIKRLSAALADHEDQQAADIVRLLLFTGARRGEVQAARWDQFNFESGVWTKPGATTKQKTEHRVPLSAPARQLLVEIRERAEKSAKKKNKDVSEYVFPGRSSGHRIELKNDWAALCEAAKIKGARLHDLRHTYASLLAGSGLGLPIIGALLGHTQAQTTQRYAHLADEPLRRATETVGAIVTGQPSAEIVAIKAGR